MSEADNVRVTEISRLIEQKQAALAATEKLNPNMKKTEVHAPADTPPEQWEPPIPFDIVTVPPFPIDSLPEPIKSYALALSEDKQVPVDMPAVQLLAAMASCVHGKYKIKIRLD